MVKTKFFLNIFLITVLIIIATSLNAEETAPWSEFSKWYQWKEQTSLTEKQKEVISYLAIATEIFNRGNNTRGSYPESKYGMLDIQGAVDITKKSITDLEKLPCPKECVEYRNLSIAILKDVVRYHKLRINYDEGTEKFKKQHEKFIIDELEKSLEGGNRLNAYFAAMREVGLFDNILDEMAELGLISKKDLDDLYYYSEEIDAGIAPKCPECSAEMRRVPILYENVTEDKIYNKDGKIIAFPAGDIPDYKGSPHFAYICDKCPTWYEGYPSPNKGKIILRKWGWGLYNWRYRKSGSKE